jgi:hypothetical protein
VIVPRLYPVSTGAAFVRPTLLGLVKWWEKGSAEAILTPKTTPRRIARKELLLACNSIDVKRIVQIARG